MRNGLNIAFFGSSLVSAYWNGAATYYRGIVRALNRRGHDITFYEPDAWDRQANRDIADPDWARVVVYAGTGETGVMRALEQAARADVIIKASGVGVFDELLEREVAGLRGPGRLVVFWDVDAPATLERMANDPADPFHTYVGAYDLMLTYGGGEPVVQRYNALGAAVCVPVYNALDPETHHPVPPDPRFVADLAFIGNRLPDRERRVEEFLLRPATRLAQRMFLLGGNGWDDKPMPSNVRRLGHVFTRDHNAINASALAVLNINRDSMATFGFSPPTRVFEAAGAAACLITDAWEGIEAFLEPGSEVLVAEDGDSVVDLVESLEPVRAAAVGRRALRRVLAEHTYARRAAQVEAILEGRAVRPAGADA